MLDRPQSFTPEQVRTLREFADNVAAGRRMMRWLGWLGAIAIGASGLVYYVVGIRNGLRMQP